MPAGWNCFHVSMDRRTLLEEKGILTKIIMSWQGPSVTCEKKAGVLNKNNVTRCDTVV
jgi:hypothetical protein